MSATLPFIVSYDIFFFHLPPITLLYDSSQVYYKNIPDEHKTRKNTLHHAYGIEGTKPDKINIFDQTQIA